MTDDQIRSLYQNIISQLPTQYRNTTLDFHEDAYSSYYNHVDNKIVLNRVEIESRSQECIAAIIGHELAHSICNHQSLLQLNPQVEWTCDQISLFLLSLVGIDSKKAALDLADAWVEQINKGLIAVNSECHGDTFERISILRNYSRR